MAVQVRIRLQRVAPLLNKVVSADVYWIRGSLQGTAGNDRTRQTICKKCRPTQGDIVLRTATKKPSPHTRPNVPTQTPSP